MHFSTERESRLRAFLTSLLPDNRCSKPVKGKPKYEPALNVESIGPIINGNARAAVCSARELITQYQEVCKQVAVGERAVRSVSDWDGDCQALERILQRQGQKAKAEVFHVLQHQVKDSDEQMVGEADHDLWTRYALTSMEQRKHATDSWNGWAATAKYAQKGIHRMVKDLPGDID